MIDVMVLFGADRKKAVKQMEQVYLLEEKIATVRSKLYYSTKFIFLFRCLSL